jgi:hypothetical protein
MSALPSTLQARLATINELISQGYVSRSQAVALQEMPDYQAWQDTETAQIDLIQWQIEQLIDGPKEGELSELPIPRQDYALAMEEVTKAFLVQYRTGAPPEVLDRFEVYLDYCQDELDRLEAENQPAETDAMDPAALNDEAAAAMQMSQPLQ